MQVFEANFDGLVGPTHNYSGLAVGNLASQDHKHQRSNPKQAALQGLEKMKYLSDLGLVQGVLAPQARPDVVTLRRLGFYGSDEQVIIQAAKKAPDLLSACSSASSMWTANAATVTPSSDTRDGRVHFTPANLMSHFHRCIETETTARLLRATFPEPEHFQIHPTLPSTATFSDEGAANHTRLCQSHADIGCHLYVYGANQVSESHRFQARQSLYASQAIARQHTVDERHCVFAQQSAEAINAGVFHNDVIAVGNQSLLFCHQQAFADNQKVYKELQRKQQGLNIVEVSAKDVPLQDAVSSYLFNSQLLTLPDKSTLLLTPSECQSIGSVSDYLSRMIERGVGIDVVASIDLRQSMANGGGPACLRLRVVLTETELAAMNQNVLLNDSLYTQLTTWVEKYYRDSLVPNDLGDPQLWLESQQALDELTQLLQLGSIYSFQQE